MSPFACPHCSKKIALFQAGGGAHMAKQMDASLLAEIPLDPEMVQSADSGKLLTVAIKKEKELNHAYRQLLSKIEKTLRLKMGPLQPKPFSVMLDAQNRQIV